MPHVGIQTDLFCSNVFVAFCFFVDPGLAPGTPAPKLTQARGPGPGHFMGPGFKATQIFVGLKFLVFFLTKRNKTVVKSLMFSREVRDYGWGVG